MRLTFFIITSHCKLDRIGDFRKILDVPQTFIKIRLRGRECIHKQKNIVTTILELRKILGIIIRYINFPPGVV